MQQQRQPGSQQPARPVRVVTPPGHPVEVWRGTVDAAPWVHLEQLAELAEYFSDPDFRSRLRTATGAEALTRCLLAPVAGPGPGGD